MLDVFRRLVKVFILNHMYLKPAVIVSWSIIFILRTVLQCMNRLNIILRLLVILQLDCNVVVLHVIITWDQTHFYFVFYLHRKELNYF